MENRSERARRDAGTSSAIGDSECGYSERDAFHEVYGRVEIERDIRESVCG